MAVRPFYAVERSNIPRSGRLCRIRFQVSIPLSTNLARILAASPDSNRKVNRDFLVFSKEILQLRLEEVDIKLIYLQLGLRRVIGGGSVMSDRANEEDAMPSVKLYPNPAVDNAYVSGLEKAAVQVFDLTGRLVYEVRDVDNVLELPVRDLEAGTYVVRIAQDGKTAVRKLNVLK